VKYDVITFGSATLDAFIQSPDLRVAPSRQSVTGEDLIVPYGIKSEVSNFLMAGGGGASNVAVGVTRLGLRAAVVARCGWDLPGKMVRQELKKEKVSDELLIQLEGDETDYSTILIGPDGKRTILVWRGRTRLEKSLLNFKKLNSFWFYIASLEGNLKLLAELIAFAKASHIKLILNPGKKEIEQGELFLDLAKKAEFLVVNREEADRLGKGKSLLLPKTTVIITEGEEGLTAHIPGKGRPACRRGRLIMPGFKVKMTDQTGAGDGFSAGLVAGLAKGWDLEKAVKLGLANGASVVTKIGARPGLIRQSEVDFWLSQPLEYHWEK